MNFKQKLIILLTLSNITTAQAVLNATIDIDTATIINTVNPALFGSNLEWVNNGNQINNSIQTPSNINSVIQQLGVTSLRFPGGALANTYRWKKTIGALANRQDGINYAGNLEPSLFGVDEFIQRCAALNLNPIITINPHERKRRVKQFVEYMNGSPQSKWGKKRVKNNGNAFCYVKYWEIGNENYSPDAAGHIAAADYVTIVKSLFIGMKKKDPNIKIGLVLEGAFLQAAWLPQVLPELATWNQDVLSTVGDSFDFAIMHFYAPFDNLVDDNELNQMVWASPIIFAENMQNITQKINQYRQDSVKIAITEHNLSFGDNPSRDDYLATTHAALTLAMNLFAMMRDPQVIFANHWSLLNNHRFGMITTNNQQVTLRPTADVFTALGAFKNADLLNLTISSPTYAVNALGNIPAIANVPLLDSIAVKTADQKIKIAIVNRDSQNNIQTQINLQQNNSTTQTFNVISYVPTDPNNPIVWQKNQYQITSFNDLMQINLAPASFTTIELP